MLLLFTYHPRISWQSTAGHTYVTLQSSPVCQQEEHTGHTSVTLHSTPVCQLAEYSWSHFCYSPLITRGSTDGGQLVTLLLLSSPHPCVSWQCTLITLRLLPLNTRVSPGRTQLVELPLLSSQHPWISGKEQLVTLRILSTHHPWISWQSTSGHTSVTLHSSPVDQLAKQSWSHFFYSPRVTLGSAGRVQLFTLLVLSTHNPWISWQSTYGYTSINLHSSPVD